MIVSFADDFLSSVGKIRLVIHPILFWSWCARMLTYYSILIIISIPFTRYGNSMNQNGIGRFPDFGAESKVWLCETSLLISLASQPTAKVGWLVRLYPDESIDLGLL